MASLNNIKYNEKKEPRQVINKYENGKSQVIYKRGYNISIQ